MAEKEDPDKTISEDLVVTKYKMAGEIVNRVLKEVIAKCIVGASVRSICEHGDNLITEATGKVFKKDKDMKKGIAFPTCISANNCICHFCPTPTEPDYILKDHDILKVDLGAHVDGYIAVVAHTIVIGASPSVKVTGRHADVILAAHFASEAALRLIKPGNVTYSVTEMVQKISNAYKCKPIEGMLSHQLKRFKIDGDKTIIQNPSDIQKKEHEKFEFETHEVYAMDVLISTGEGVGRETNTRVTIYKKTDETYQLKLKASRNFFSEVNNKYGAMPFNLRGFEDEKKAKLGVVECLKHKVIEPFPVLYEKSGEYVAHFKYTVLLMPSGGHKITGLPVDVGQYSSEYSHLDDPTLTALLKQTTNLKTVKKKNKKKIGRALGTADTPAEGAGVVPVPTASAVEGTA